MDTENFFSAKGRLRRRDHAIRVFLLAIPLVILRAVLDETTDPFSVLLIAGVSIAIATVSLLQSIKRLHDLDMSGWYCLLGLIPLVNLGFGLYTLFKEGTPGPNRYGENPKAKLL